MASFGLFVMVIALSGVLPIFKNGSLIACVIIDTKFWFQLLIYNILEKQVDKIISSHSFWLKKTNFFCSCFFSYIYCLINAQIETAFC